MFRPLEDSESDEETQNADHEILEFPLSDYSDDDSDDESSFQKF
jgi:hypothetical protein